MRRSVQYLAEWLASNPWGLVALVALVVVVPILLLGEVSASDTQRRLRNERLELGAQAAERGAAAIQTRISISRQQLEGLGIREDLRPALQLRDLSAVKLVLGRAFDGVTDLEAIDIADLTGAVFATQTSASNLTGGTASPSVESIADRDYFNVARAGMTSVVGVDGRPLTIDHPVLIVTPVRELTSEPVAGVSSGRSPGRTSLARCARSSGRSRTCISWTARAPSSAAPR